MEILNQWNTEREGNDAWLKYSLLIVRKWDKVSLQLDEDHDGWGGPCTDSQSVRLDDEVTDETLDTVLDFIDTFSDDEGHRILVITDVIWSIHKFDEALSDKIRLRANMAVKNSYRFYAEGATRRWYIDLPQYIGNRADLEMVAGADTMLNVMADGKDEVTLVLSGLPFPGSNQLEFVRLADEIGDGAWYKLNTLNGDTVDMEMWLCGVTKFVFGNFPQSIYFL